VAVVILHVHTHTHTHTYIYIYNVSREFKSGGLHEKHIVVLGNLETISAFAYRHRETKKTLCRGGWSQDFPDTDF